MMSTMASAVRGSVATLVVVFLFIQPSRGDLGIGIISSAELTGWGSDSPGLGLDEASFFDAIAGEDFEDGEDLGLNLLQNHAGYKKKPEAAVVEPTVTVVGDTDADMGVAGLSPESFGDLMGLETGFDENPGLALFQKGASKIMKRGPSSSMSMSADGSLSDDVAPGSIHTPGDGSMKLSIRGDGTMMAY